MPARAAVRRGVAALLIGLPLIGAALAADPHAEIVTLARAGAPHLALQIIDETQPGYRGDDAGWMAWERQRLELLRDLGAWDALLQRIADHPSSLAPSFAEWTRTLHAEAAIATGDGATARAQLRTLIWYRTDDASREAASLWRRQVIRSYLAEEQYEDAYLAMVRYRQDYGEDPAFRELPARVLLSADRPGDALAILAAGDGPETTALQLLATLRAGRETPATVGAEAEKQAVQARKDGIERDAARFWSVAAAAAAAAEQPAARVAALEAGLASDGLVDDDTLFRLTADDLWTAYLALGRQLGNRAQLLVGQDRRWLALASELQAADPHSAQALYATVGLTENDPVLRSAAHATFANLIAETPNGATLLQRLYLESMHFSTPGDIPEALRRRLGERALEDGELRLASRLLTGLAVPTDADEAFSWRLQRARVQVLGGNPQRGAEELKQLIHEAPEQSTAHYDRVLQVIFDLQTVSEHDRALVLLETLEPLAGEPRQRRELPFWIADLHRTAGRPAQAARYYLRSATSDDPLAMDEWVRNARHQAALTLADAGLTADARNLLQDLILTAPEPSRRAALQRDLQQLRLPE